MGFNGTTKNVMSHINTIIEKLNHVVSGNLLTEI